MIEKSTYSTITDTERRLEKRNRALADKEMDETFISLALLTRMYEEAGDDIEFGGYCAPATLYNLVGADHTPLSRAPSLGETDLMYKIIDHRNRELDLDIIMPSTSTQFIEELQNPLTHGALIVNSGDLQTLPRRAEDLEWEMTPEGAFVDTEHTILVTHVVGLRCYHFPISLTDVLVVDTMSEEPGRIYQPFYAEDRDSLVDYFSSADYDLEGRRHIYMFQQK